MCHLHALAQVLNWSAPVGFSRPYELSERELALWSSRSKVLFSGGLYETVRRAALEFYYGTEIHEFRDWAAFDEISKEVVIPLSSSDKKCPFGISRLLKLAPETQSPMLCPATQLPVLLHESACLIQSINLAFGLLPLSPLYN